MDLQRQPAFARGAALSRNSASVKLAPENFTTTLCTTSPLQTLLLSCL
jgi:hypothetical protein